MGARAGDRGGRAGRGGARHPGRLRQRLALQRDRRASDPADAGGRLRRPRARRPPRAGPVGGRRRRAARVPPGSGPRGGGGAHPLPLEGLAFAEPLPRRRRRRPRAGARGGCPLERPRGRRLAPRRQRSPGLDGRPLVRGLRTWRSSARADSSRSAGCANHVRRLRRLRPRPRRRAADVLRTVRAPAPGPGVGGNRRLRAGPPDRLARSRPRHAGLQRAEAARAARPGGDRAYALFDHRLLAVVECAAARPARTRAHRRARPQRKPRQRDRAPRRAEQRRRDAARDLRQRGRSRR